MTPRCVFKIVDGKHIQGEYRDLVPKRKGARNLPFTAEYGKSWRFVEPAKQATADVDLNGKWALRQADDTQLRAPTRAATSVTTARIRSACSSRTART